MIHENLHQSFFVHFQLKSGLLDRSKIVFFSPQLQAQENVDVFSQRWFYGGKLLGDKTSVDEAKVQPGYIIQVIINTEKQAAS